MELRCTDRISDVEYRAVLEGLSVHSEEKLGDGAIRELGVFSEADGRLQGGLIGQTIGAWLEVEYLWVADELRGQGLGTKLLEAAEQHAAKRGCMNAYLYTYCFQAPTFYRKQGYAEAFSLDGYPNGGSKIFFTKELK